MDLKWGILRALRKVMEIPAERNEEYASEKRFGDLHECIIKLSLTEGIAVGDKEGAPDGTPVGAAVGDTDGIPLGANDTDGTPEGVAVGLRVGS